MPARRRASGHRVYLAPQALHRYFFGRETLCVSDWPSPQEADAIRPQPGAAVRAQAASAGCRRSRRATALATRPMTTLVRIGDHFGGRSRTAPRRRSATVGRCGSTPTCSTSTGTDTGREAALPGLTASPDRVRSTPAAASGPTGRAKVRMVRAGARSSHRRPMWISSPNRVGGGVTPPPPTPPDVRVRIRRFASAPGGGGFDR